jgi:hypothetical protein
VREANFARPRYHHTSELNFEAYLKSGKGQNQLFRANPNVVRRSLDCVAKVGGMRPARNNRIPRRPPLESILRLPVESLNQKFRRGPFKIVLQQYPLESGQAVTNETVPVAATAAHQLQS